jgi:hypothetical protein
MLLPKQTLVGAATISRHMSAFCGPSYNSLVVNWRGYQRYYLDSRPLASASGPVHALVAKARTTVRSGRRLTRFRVAHFDAGHKWAKLKARLHINQAISAKV